MIYILNLFIYPYRLINFNIIELFTLNEVVVNFKRIYYKLVLIINP